MWGHLRPAGLIRHWCRWIQPSVLQPAHFLSAAASLQTQTTISFLSERAFGVKQRAKPTVKSAVWNGIISADPQSGERPRDKSGEWNKTQIGAMATWPLWAAQTNSREQKRGEAESRMPIKWFPNALQHDDRRQTDSLLQQPFVHIAVKTEKITWMFPATGWSDDEEEEESEPQRSVRSCFQLVCQTHPVSPGSEPGTFTWSDTEGLYSGWFKLRFGSHTPEVMQISVFKFGAVWSTNSKKPWRS